MSDRFFEIAQEITDRYLQILELTPKEATYRRYLTESCLLFTSFVAFVADDWDKLKNNV